MTEPTELAPTLKAPGDGRIILVVLDGLGGFRGERPSELTSARTPNLDTLAAEGSSGLHYPVAPGITPGSGAGHLGLFGYDPLQYSLGRGALSAAGIGFEMKPGDVAARVNFCTIGPDGVVLDRRAGRIPTEENERLCRKVIEGLQLEDVELFLRTEREHRALLVLRGDNLSPHITDSDPGLAGRQATVPQATTPEAERAASIVQRFLDHVKTVLEGEKANFLLLRGFDTLPHLPSFLERYGLTACGIAGYPMYRGIARILGMAVTDPVVSPSEIAKELTARWNDHDFFYLHFKKPDSAGEDGDYDAKVAAIEEFDAAVPDIVHLQPDVICVTGDHSTPAPMKAHSWHPVPFLMRGPWVAVDGEQAFDEVSARSGGLGTVQAKHLMNLMLAAAMRLHKFGA